MSFSVFFPLGQRYIQGLSHYDSTIHFRDSFCSLFWGTEADEAESLGAPTLSHHLQHNNIVYVLFCLASCHSGFQLYNGSLYTGTPVVFKTLPRPKSPSKTVGDKHTLSFLSNWMSDSLPVIVCICFPEPLVIFWCLSRNEWNLANLCNLLQFIMYYYICCPSLNEHLYISHSSCSKIFMHPHSTLPWWTLFWYPLICAVTVVTVGWLQVTSDFCPSILSNLQAYGLNSYFSPSFYQTSAFCTISLLPKVRLGQEQFYHRNNSRIV